MTGAGFLIKRALLKGADLRPEVELKPEQSRAVSKILREPSMLLYHPVGTGKTLSSIAAGEQLSGPKEVVVPAALRENYRKELGKFVKGKAPAYDIKSYQRAVTGGLGEPAPAMTVFDEAHRMGRVGTMMSRLPEQAKGKVVFLTGTPVRNEPAEIVPMLKVLAQGRNPPGSAQSFKERFIGEKYVSPGFWGWLKGAKPGVEQVLIRRKELKGLLAGRVDYAPARGEFPAVHSQDIEIEMTPRQTELYRGLMHSNPVLAYKVRRNLPPSKQESSQLNAFLTAVRQVSNVPHSYDVTLKSDNPLGSSPKLQRMANEITSRAGDPHFKALVYSNYLESGILPMARQLERQGIPHAVFHGGLTDRERKRIVDDYNSGRIKVLFASGAGSEGLDLKGTQLLQVMEPHWNTARIDQIIGRAVRHKSHEGLPGEKQRVLVQRFFANPQKNLLQRIGLFSPDTGADRYMHNLSQQKQKIVEQLLDVLKEVGSGDNR